MHHLKVYIHKYAIRSVYFESSTLQRVEGVVTLIHKVQKSWGIYKIMDHIFIRPENGLFTHHLHDSICRQTDTICRTYSQ